MKKDNYEITKQNAARLFLDYNQDMMIEKFNLKNDTSYLYINFFGCSYRIHRKTGALEREITASHYEESSTYQEAMSIYDVLCYSVTTPHLQGSWNCLNSLPGVAQTSGLGTTLFEKYEHFFGEHEDLFLKACIELGGKPAAFGDAGFIFQVYDFFPLLLRYYRADEEFGASVSLLWDTNTLDFMHYETTYYVAQFLLDTLERKIRAYQPES